MSTYRGHCNHKMIHKILKDYGKDLKEHEKEALKALRTKIHEIIGGIKNIEITIYLDDIEIEPVTIKEGAGDNELVIQFTKDGEVDFAWVQKTFGQKLYEAVTDLAWNVLDAIADALKSVISIAKNALVSSARERIEWKKE